MASVELRRRFAAEGRQVDGDLYLPLAAARRLVAACHQADVAVIAVEIFRWPAEVSRPQVERSADFSEIDDQSWSRYLDRCVSAAEQVLADYQPHPELWVSFVLLDQAAWEPEEPIA